MAIENSDLPPSFLNEIVINGNETITTIRSNLKGAPDVKSWIREYERKSNTKWNLRTSRPFGTRILCSYKYTCHHSGFNKVPNSQKKRISKNSNCPAMINIKIKLDSKDVKRTDQYAKRGLLAVITISRSHNHSLETSESLRFLPSNDCREAFFQYFDDGMNTTEAIKFHENNLRMQKNFSIEMLANSRLNPSYRSVKYWYTNWKNSGRCSSSESIQNTEENPFFQPIFPKNTENPFFQPLFAQSAEENTFLHEPEITIHSPPELYEDIHSNLDSPSSPHSPTEPQKNNCENKELYNSFIAAINHCHERFTSSDSGLRKMTECLNKMSSVGQWENFLHSGVPDH